MSLFPLNVFKSSCFGDVLLLFVAQRSFLKARRLPITKTAVTLQTSCQSFAGRTDTSRAFVNSCKTSLQLPHVFAWTSSLSLSQRRTDVRWLCVTLLTGAPAELEWRFACYSLQCLPRFVFITPTGCLMSCRHSPQCGPSTLWLLSSSWQWSPCWRSCCSTSQSSKCMEMSKNCQVSDAKMFTLSMEVLK